MKSLALGFLCVALRVLPYAPNLSPMGATSVYAGRHLPRWKALALVFGSMAVGDALLSYFRGYPLVTSVTPFVYGAFALEVALGGWWRNRRGGVWSATTVGALGFFVISNFGVWLSGMYGVTFAGFASCYVAALPFFPATLLGDLLWTSAFVLLERTTSRSNRGSNALAQATA